MTAITDTLAPARPRVTEGRPAGFGRDLAAIAGRALRAVPRDPAAVLPPVFIALFFFIVNIATLKTDRGHPDLTTGLRDRDRDLAGRDRHLPRPGAGTRRPGRYFDRLLLTPVRRTPSCSATWPPTSRWRRAHCPDPGAGDHPRRALSGGPLGVLVFVSRLALELAFAGFGYAIALKTGNPAAVNSTFLLFFPFLFLTSAYVPRNQLSGWLNTVAGFNPVTYLLGGLRSLVLGSGGSGANSVRRSWPSPSSA